MSEVLQRVISNIRPVNETARRVAADRQGVLTKPPGSLGRLEDIAIDLAGVMSTPEPSPEPCALVLAAADHGITEEGVSAYPKKVTAQMVRNFLAGGAAVNVIADSVGMQMFLVDAGVDAEMIGHPRLHDRKACRGTANFALGPAMSEEQTVSLIESGIDFVYELCERGYRAIALGDMGIGNTSSAAAITALLTGSPAERVTGRGTMVDNATLERKRRVVEKALSQYRASAEDGLSVLGAVGGCETGFLAGCILAAVSRGVPVILDGFPTTAAALVAHRLHSEVARYCIAGHLSQEPGHRIALDHLGLEPLLNLKMRLGEGTGAVLAYSIVRAACRCLSDMATFSEAAVHNRIA